MSALDTPTGSLTGAPVLPTPATARIRRDALLLQLILIAGILTWHYWYVLKRLVWLWQSHGDWSHGFIIPLFSIYYLYLQRDRMPTPLARSGRVSMIAGGLLLTASFLLYLRSTMIMQEYPKTVSLVLTIAGISLMLFGWPMTRWAWFGIAFLMFAMPVPDRLYEQLTIPLRGVAANISAAILSMVPGMLAEPQGTLVEYMYQGRVGTLDVERACSGMRLLVTMSALGVAMAFLNERPLWQRMIVILACVPIAIFCNIVRVTTTGFLYVFGREDLASGAPHMLLGLGMLVVAFALYSAINYILSHLFVDGDHSPATPAGSAEVTA